jgi:hypothetical protein
MLPLSFAFGGWGMVAGLRCFSAGLPAWFVVILDDPRTRAYFIGIKYNYTPVFSRFPCSLSCLP